LFLLLKDDDGNVERLLDEKEESAVIVLVVRTVTGATARYIVVSRLPLGFLTFEKDLKSEDKGKREKISKGEKTRKRENDGSEEMDFYRR
jgi:hypothetical protein